MTFVLSPPGQHGLPLLTPGYPMFFVSKSNDPSDLSRYQSLLSSFSTEVHTAKSSHFHNKINSAPDMRNLFRTFNSLLCPPPPPPTISITADDFATFFTDKTRTISNQLSPPHTQDLQPTTSTAQTPIFSFRPLTEAEVSKLLLSSHPTTCPLDPIPSHLLQAISPTLLPPLTHIINTSLHTGIFPTAFKQAWVIPLLKKPTLNTSLLGNYRPVSLLPFAAEKLLEWVVFNQLSLFLSQYNKRTAKQSGFQEWPFTETALLSVTEALRMQRPIPNHQSSFCWIFLLLLTLSIIRSSCPPSHRWASLGFHFAGLNPISRQVFQGGLGRGGIQNNQLVTGVPSGFGSWTSPLLHIHYITGSHHTGTWLLLSLLRRWHAALSLFSTWWSNGSCTDLRLPGGHLGMNERTSTTAQHGKDWASCLPCHSDSTAWLHDSVRLINNYPINFGQKSWCNFWWPADLQRAHCKDCSILQVCATQHQKD